jgi:hypothetical protein
MWRIRLISIDVALDTDNVSCLFFMIPIPPAQSYASCWHRFRHYLFQLACHNFFMYPKRECIGWSVWGIPMCSICLSLMCPVLSTFESKARFADFLKIFAYLWVIVLWNPVVWSLVVSIKKTSLRNIYPEIELMNSPSGYIAENQNVHGE